MAPQLNGKRALIVDLNPPLDDDELDDEAPF
jgi:hypothetical protein